MCPFNALTLKVDNQERLPIVEKEGFPQYDMKAEIDDEKCVRCTICEEVCPRDAIDRNVPAYEGTYQDRLPGQRIARPHSRPRRPSRSTRRNAPCAACVVHSVLPSGSSTRNLLPKSEKSRAM